MISENCLIRDIISIFPAFGIPFLDIFDIKTSHSALVKPLKKDYNNDAKKRTYLISSFGISKTLFDESEEKA